MKRKDIEQKEQKNINEARDVESLLFFFILLSFVFFFTFVIKTLSKHGRDGLSPAEQSI